MTLSATVKENELTTDVTVAEEMSDEEIRAQIAKLKQIVEMIGGDNVSAQPLRDQIEVFINALADRTKER